MRKAVVAVMALAASAPVAASAQFRAQGGHVAPPADFGQTTPSIDTMHDRDTIRQGRASGQLSRREARRLRREADQIDTLATRYGSDGMSEAEAREVQTREHVLNDQVIAKRTQGFPGKQNH